MSTINAQIIAARLRVSKNFSLLVEAGVDAFMAADIAGKLKHLAAHEVRFADDKVVVNYKTCTTVRSVEFAIAA